MKCISILAAACLFLSACSTAKTRGIIKGTKSKVMAKYQTTKINPKQLMRCSLDSFQEIMGPLLAQEKLETEIAGPRQQADGLMKISFSVLPDGKNYRISSDFSEDTEQTTGYVIQDDPIKIVILETIPHLKTLTAYKPVFLHTIFKGTGLYTYFKTNSIMSPMNMTQPRATMAVGWCEQ